MSFGFELWHDRDSCRREMGISRLPPDLPTRPSCIAGAALPRAAGWRGGDICRHGLGEHRRRAFEAAAYQRPFNQAPFLAEGFCVYRCRRLRDDDIFADFPAGAGLAADRQNSGIGHSARAFASAIVSESFELMYVTDVKI